MTDMRVRKLWKKTRIERLTREDLRYLSKLPYLSSIEILSSMPPEKVGFRFSIENLRHDFEVSHNTIKRWLQYLESVYFHYSIRPHSKKIASSIKKEPNV